jgi:hypothetical protein
MKCSWEEKIPNEVLYIIFLVRRHFVDIFLAVFKVILYSCCFEIHNKNQNADFLHSGAVCVHVSDEIKLRPEPM